MSRVSKKRRTGLSRVDVLVVLTLIAVGIGLLFPAVYAAQEADAAKQTQNNLKQLAQSLHTFNDLYKKMPPAYGTIGNVKVGMNTSLHIHLLFVVQEDLYKQYFDAAMGKDKKVAPAVVATYVSKMDPSLKKKKGEGIQNFAANLRVFSDVGVAMGADAGKDMPALRDSEPGTGGIPRTFPDGTSNTMVFATKYAYCGEGGSRYDARPNAKTAAFFGQSAAKKKAHASDTGVTFQIMPSPKDCLCAPLLAQSFMEKAIHIALADGSVRPVSANLSAATWNSVMQPNDGVPLGSDW